MLTAAACFALLTGVASAAPKRRWPLSDGQAKCWNFYSNITATAENIDIESVIGGIPANEQVWIQTQLDTFGAGSTIMKQIAAAPTQTQSGTYSLYFEYCEPKNGDIKGVFQTEHGIVGTLEYWNVILDGKTDNSFAESAAAAGWATLSYDRLGVGNSSHPNGITTVQINYEIEQAIVIAQHLRDGSFYGIPSFDKVVGVGHSYGSNLLVGLAAVAPDAFDQIVLTGFTNNVTSGPLGLAGFESTIAHVAYPDRFPFGNDYVITPTVSIDQQEFFHYPNYTDSALQLFTNTKGDYTIGQIYSIGVSTSKSRANYTKPTFVITGENDAPYCAADCYVTSLGDNHTQLYTARALFPSVADSNFSTYVVSDTGHGINFHTTAYGAYQQIIDFVSGH